MVKTPKSIAAIHTLYYENAWPVIKIAKHLGITRQAVYERMRHEGMVYRSRKATTSSSERSTLEQLYVVEGLTIAEIGRRLDCSWGRVAGALDRLGIKRESHRTVQNTLGLDSLDIGESVEVETQGDTPFRAYFEAKSLNIRIVTRRLSSTRFSIIRTPLLNAATVGSMLEEGMTVKEIAGIFRADPKTIKTLIF